ncbi:DUF4870 domain-containing protein [Wenyingzhuangia sp. IMCC45574]
MRVVNNKNDQNIATILHLSGFLSGFLPIVIPLVIWISKKDESEFINEHGKSALNFQISVIILGLIAFGVVLFTLGIGAFLIIPLTLIFCLLYVVFIIQAAIAAYGGKYYKYPFSWDIIK